MSDQYNGFRQEPSPSETNGAFTTRDAAPDMGENGNGAIERADPVIQYGGYGGYADPAGIRYQAPRPPEYNTARLQPRADGGRGGEKGGKKTRFAAFVAVSVVLCLMFGFVGAAGGGAVTYFFLANNQTQLQDNSGREFTLPPVESTAADDGQEEKASTPLAAKTATGSELTASEIFELCSPSVVAIRTEGTTVNAFGRPSSYASAGSGFIISADGYIVTNYHVIESASKITVVLSAGAEHPASLVGGDQATDIAVLKIDKRGLSPLTFGDSAEIKVGDPVAAIGNPLGELANSLTTGVISALERELDIYELPMRMLQTDASISPGNSGGPLLNRYGQVVGIVSAKSVASGVEGLGFAIPANYAREVINDLLVNGYVTGRPSMGVTIRDVTREISQYYDLPEGVYIDTVESGSAADEAGLKSGDVIIAVDGEDCKTTSELVKIKNEHKPGDTLTITYIREKSERTCQLVLKESVPSLTKPGELNPDSFNGGRYLPEDSPEA